jgi:hypothetical protein
MRTCAQIITRALVRAAIIDAGRNPTDAELDSGFLALKSLYTGAVTGGILGRSRRVRPTDDYTACERDWITVDAADEFTITIPGGFTVCCNDDGEWTCCEAPSDTRGPEDLTFVIITDGTETVTYLYDAYDGRWTAIEPLEATDDAPFSGRDAEGLSCWLATELAEEFQTQVGPLTIRRAMAFKSQLAQRAAQSQPVQHQYF